MLIELIYEIYDGLPLLTKALQITMTSPPAPSAQLPALLHSGTPTGHSLAAHTKTTRRAAPSAVRGWTPSVAGEVTTASDGSVSLAPTSKDPTSATNAVFNASAVSVGAVIGVPEFPGGGETQSSESF